MLVVLALLVSLMSINCSAFDYIGWWDTWYAQGGNSGAGSRSFLASYKAEIMNDFLKHHTIDSVIEFGCGDGYNLGFIQYKEYLGLDVSKTTIKNCMELYKNDDTKSFILYDPKYFANKGFKHVDLVVCLDVLYHIIDENEYIKTLDDIFSFKSQYIILYTTMTPKNNDGTSPEIYHRNTLKYLEKYSSDYTYAVVENRYKDITGGSEAAWVFCSKKTVK